MKKHILSFVGKKANLLLNSPAFYDFEKQVSFINAEKTMSVVTFAKENTTIETCTIENSDPDEFSILKPQTRITETIESSDLDEFSLNFSGTKETRTIEDSDIDSIFSITSRITKTIENSDVDEFSINPPYTKQTFTIEDSDMDEFSLA